MQPVGLPVQQADEHGSNARPAPSNTRRGAEVARLARRCEARGVPSFSPALALRAAAVLLAACAACSSDVTFKPVACNLDPWQCPAGQTCWPKDTAGTFGCLNSASGKHKGDACVNTAGSPTCGDAMVCLQLSGAGSGTCTEYCDPATAGRGCGDGETCRGVSLSGTSSSFHVCVGSSPPQDAGADAGADTGSDSAATDAGSGD